MLAMTDGAYGNLHLYYGDIHNHCNLSYGKGTLDEALRNARLQLDFASVTVHGHWEDMPVDDPRLGYLVDYHRRGFQKASAVWEDYLEQIDAANCDGDFVAFPSFEWHSMQYGDHCIYFRDDASREIFRAADIEEMREALRRHRQPGFLIPHHVGYRQGFRGMDWRHFTTEFSPVVEIMSFHGASEHSDAMPAYLHAMGPRDFASTVQYGLEQGHIFGFIGATDHHSAHPGTYGYGQAAVWAADLSRDGIWEAIAKRRTYAVTGDRIRLAFALNGRPMGEIVPASRERWIEVEVEGGAAIDYVEVLHNNRVIRRESAVPSGFDVKRPVKVRLEMGWGEAETLTDWELDVWIEGGELLDIEPHLRGHDITVALDEDDSCVLSYLDYGERNRVRLKTRSPRNPTVTSSAAQGITLTVRGDADTKIHAKVNGIHAALPVTALQKGARSCYLSGFVSPCFVFHRAVPQTEYQHRFALAHQAAGEQRDWYYVRVRQYNGQWAWSSPIWVQPGGS